MNKLPLLVTRDLITFPKFPLQFQIGRTQSIKTATEAYNDHSGLVILTAQKDPQGKASLENIFESGVLARITSFDPTNATPITIQLLGEARVSIVSIEGKEVLYANYKAITDKNNDSVEAYKIQEKLLSEITQQLSGFGGGVFNDEMLKPFASAKPSEFADSFATYIPFSLEQKYQFLGEADVIKRLNMILANLNSLGMGVMPGMDMKTIVGGPEISAPENQVKQDIDSKVNEKLQNQQREFMLREQLKQVEDELAKITGEADDETSIRQKIDEGDFPKPVKKKLRKELRKLKQTPSASAESGVIRSWIDTVMELPWKKKSKESLEIKAVQTKLDEDHFGLIKPKERIIEHLAVKQNNPNSKGTIIAFSGPPGTGKTSLATSIADALGREFVKVSLGGVKDESEIRGHRRTYVGSMPGKIITAMKKAGVTNPVILLDEIDKMASDHKGDPASAMLEVLDPSQNHKFQDHYLEEEYDLSNVMFIATANYLQNIPAALYDRLEIIELDTYTELEKLEIAKQYLMPKALKETGLMKSQLKISDKIILEIIRGYTLEAGVRQLYRVLEKISRKIVVENLKTGEKNIKAISSERINKYLGIKRFDFSNKDKTPQVGTTQGLAWTGYGGDILPIEVTVYPGKGELVITGQLQDVMTESSKIALSYIRANAEKFEIETFREINGEKKNIFTDFDIHVHSPDGSTPKDGPSAGITFTTSLISALTGKKIAADIAMTGEITLRGLVFPIGGLKEKTLAAMRSGIKTVIVPYKNIKDLEDITKEAKEALEIIPVKKYEDVYEIVFNGNKK